MFLEPHQGQQCRQYLISSYSSVIRYHLNIIDQWKLGLKMHREAALYCVTYSSEKKVFGQPINSTSNEHFVLY